MAFLSDRGLTWTLRAVIIVLVVGGAAFILYYRSDQHVESGPSVLERRIKAAEQAVVKTPDNIPARLALARAYKEAKRPDDALDQYDQVLKVDPENRAALLGRGNVQLERDDLDAAEKAFQKITGTAGKGEFASADPQLEEAHYYLGVIADRRGETKRAVNELEAAVRIEPGDSDAWYLLGTVHLKSGNADLATKALQEALKFVPTGWCEPYTALAQAYTTLGNAPQAEYASAMLDFCQDRSSDAQRRLTALVDGPVGVKAMLGLGMIADDSGDSTKAVEWYRKVLARDPKNFYATTALARIQSGTTGAPSHPAIPTKPPVTRQAIAQRPAGLGVLS